MPAMKTNALRLIAGKTAAARIEREGCHAGLFSLVLGASGGPKWLVLAGLDRFVFGEFLAGAEQHIAHLGSSIGAWRMTAACHPDAASQMAQFRSVYLSMEFEETRRPSRITRDSYRVLERMFSPQARAAILANAKRSLHILAVRGKGLCGAQNIAAEGVGLIRAAAANKSSRQSLARHYERAVLSSRMDEAFDWPEDFGQVHGTLSTDSLFDALMASGSIPAVVSPIKNLPGMPEGLYRDGGIIDYHFAAPPRISAPHLDEGAGLSLYPHFYPTLVPGWFDKKLTGRHRNPAEIDSMLLLSPSEEFVKSLPGHKIPDRKDFSRMSEAERVAYWTRVADESERLADEFSQLLQDHGSFMGRLEKAA